MRLLTWLLMIWLGTVCSFTLTPAQSNSPLEPTPTPTEPPGTLGPTFDAATNPLTGLPLPEAAQSRPPVIVKVSNSPAIVRPQSGISLADIVYEHYTEVGITRFSAIFLTHAPERVGSIRSARLIDYELAPMYGALLAFSGASLGVDKRIYGTQHVINILCRTAADPEMCARDVFNIGPVGDLPPSDFVDRAYKAAYIGPPIYTRDEELPIPHNLFVDLELLWQRAARDGHTQRPPLEGMRFHPEPPDFPHTSGIYAEVRYLTTTVEWHYHPPTGRYYRSTNGERHFDALTETQISADNVLIVYAGHYLTDIVESGSGDNVHWSAQITLWPRGAGVLLRDGRAYEVEWRRGSRYELLTLWTRDGQPVPLKPGQTWVQVVRTPEQMEPPFERVVVG
ncbi:MAG: DUF3048 domain-containing protein [Anaerolineae bacterium]